MEQRSEKAKYAKESKWCQCRVDMELTLALLSKRGARGISYRKKIHQQYGKKNTHKIKLVHCRPSTWAMTPTGWTCWRSPGKGAATSTLPGAPFNGTVARDWSAFFFTNQFLRQYKPKNIQD